MRTWLANKLFFWAYRLDRVETLFNARLLVGINQSLQEVFEDSKPAPKKRGRPLGSKNKPKDPVA